MAPRKKFLTDRNFFDKKEPTKADLKYKRKQQVLAEQNLAQLIGGRLAASHPFQLPIWVCILLITAQFAQPSFAADPDESMPSENNSTMPTADYLTTLGQNSTESFATSQIPYNVRHRSTQAVPVLDDMTVIDELTTYTKRIPLSASEIEHIEKYNDLVSRGKKLLNEGRYDEALRVFNATDIYIKDKLGEKSQDILPKIAFLRAVCLLNLKEYSKAMPYLEAAIEHDPKNSEVRAAYAYTLANINRVPESKKQFRLALRYGIPSENSFHSYASSQAIHTNYEEASWALEEGIKHYANSRKCRCLHARIWLQEVLNSSKIDIHADEVPWLDINSNGVSMLVENCLGGDEGVEPELIASVSTAFAVLSAYEALEYGSKSEVEHARSAVKKAQEYIAHFEFASKGLSSPELAKHIEFAQSLLSKAKEQIELNDRRPQLVRPTIYRPRV